MRKIHYVIIAMLVVLAGTVQGQENHNAVTMRNLNLFSDIYKQLDLFYVDTLNADTVIGWGIRSMLRQVDPFTDYYPEGDNELRQMSTGKYAGIGSVVRYNRKEKRTMIGEPYEGTPSQKAGLLPGDILLSVNNQRITTMEELKAILFDREVGENVEAIIYRGGERYRVELTLGEYKG